MTEAAKPRPPEARDLSAFRESFLMFFPEQDSATLRRAGVLLQDAAQQGEPYDSGEPLGAQEIRAAALDLLFVARDLEALGTPAAQRGLDGKELKLSRKAARWAGLIEALSLEMVEVVGDPPGTTEEGR